VTGHKGNFSNTYGIHRQAIAQFNDVILKVEPKEVSMLLKYANEIYLQAAGSAAFREVPIPKLAHMDELFASDDLQSVGV